MNGGNYAGKYIATATTTQVKTGAGTLVAIVVGTTSAGAIGIIDGTSGTTVNLCELQASILPGTYEFGVTFSAGLRIVTAEASLITVIYK